MGQLLTTSFSRLFTLFIVLFTIGNVHAQVIYLNDFEGGGIGGTSFSGATSGNANLNIAGSTWATTSTFTTFTGTNPTPGTSMALNSASPATVTWTLTIPVTAGYMANITGLQFDYRSTSTSYNTLNISINGTPVYANSALNTSSSWVNVPITGLTITGVTGNISVVCVMSGGSHGANGTFRFDNFNISGTVPPLCTPPSPTISGPVTVCSGQTIMLSNAVGGGTWSSNNISVASITAGRVVTGGAPGTAVITYATGCGTNATTTITTNPLPDAGTLSGSPVVCAGASVPLSSTTAGGIWSSSAISIATVNGAGTLFGATTGNSIISYSFTNMCGTATATLSATVNPLPNAGTITGVSAVCATLSAPFSSTVSGGVWSSGSNLVATVNTGGIVYGVSGGTSIISYSYTNSCGTAVSTASVTVNDMPVVYTVTGGGSYCAGTGGLNVGLSSSQSGISYQLYHGPALGSPLIGTGLFLDFGPQVAAGNYIIVGTNTVTGCASNMAGIAIISVDPLPNVYTVTGGGSICSGIGGVHVGLNWSDAGISYQLFAGSSPDGAALPGGSGALDFGIKTVADTYTVIATNTATSCAIAMLSNAIVKVTPSVTPSVTISGATGALCSGRSHTFTAASVNGGSAPFYQWSVNGIPVATGNSYNYVPANGNTVRVKLTSNAVCPLPDTAVASVTLNVLNTETPLVNVDVNPGNVICEGMHVTYTAMPVFGGGAPVYNWVRNGATVASGSSYSYYPASGDNIYCTMKSNYVCPSVDSAASGSVHMTVYPFTQPIVTISADPGPLAALGQQVTLKATVTNTGLYSALAYQWLVNGIPVPGANTNKFVSSSFNYPAPDSVTCIVSCTGGPCDPVGVFGWIYIVIHPAGIDQAAPALDNINLFPNPSNGDFRIYGAVNRMAGNATLDLELFNMLGQIVYHTSSAIMNGMIDERINAGNAIPDGHYILRVRTKDDYRSMNVHIQHN